MKVNKGNTKHSMFDGMQIQNTTYTIELHKGKPARVTLGITSSGGTYESNATYWIPKALLESERNLIRLMLEDAVKKALVTYESKEMVKKD